MTNLYLDLHVLQTVPSSNINRDDAGSPKTALYGGVVRARVSSQSWKHAMRQTFQQAELKPAGIRTKEVATLLADSLQKQDSALEDAAALAKAQEILGAAGIKVSKTHQTGALLLISQGQVDKLAAYALSHDTLDKKELKKVFQGDQSLDLALFGRMVADNPELNVDASAQVAHAISTHEVVPEFDYYTALDEKQPKDNAGAAMLGTIEYNSSTLYRYANLNVNELVANLGAEDTVAGAKEFIRSFVLSMPTGKQNTFANKTLPSYLMVSFRTDTPVNLVSAFEEPVKAKEGYVLPSIKRLENEYESTEEFVAAPALTLVLSKFDTTEGETVANLNELLTRVGDYLAKVVPDENTND